MASHMSLRNEVLAPLLAAAHAARGVHALTLYLPNASLQLLAAADATDDALGAAAAADAARRSGRRQADLEGLASTSADAAAAARALLAAGSGAAAGAAAGAGAGAGAGALRVAGTWRRDGTAAAVEAPLDIVPPEVFAEARVGPP